MRGDQRGTLAVDLQEQGADDEGPGENQPADDAVEVGDEPGEGLVRDRAGGLADELDDPDPAGVQADAGGDVAGQRADDAEQDADRSEAEERVGDLERPAEGAQGTGEQRDATAGPELVGRNAWLARKWVAA